jgi:hypothetical protein
MRPTVVEQLTGTCRILEAVVAPNLEEPYAKHVLEGLISNLRMLSEAVPRIPAFLVADNEEARAVLSGLMGHAPSELGARIEGLLAQPAPEPTDLADLEARNDALRNLMSEAIRSGVPPREMSAIVDHLQLRAAKNPIRFAIPLPKAKAVSEVTNADSA